MFRDNDRGQALVETALVITILVFVFGSIVEFGRIFNTYLSVNYAAREGARIGALGRTDPDIDNAVKNAAISLAGAALTVSISPVQNLRYRGVPLSVKVSYALPILLPFMADIIPNPLPISATVTMRVEN